MPVSKTCEKCNASFIADRCGRRFCSRRCAGLAKADAAGLFFKRHQRNENFSQVAMECVQCGAIFRTIKSNATKSKFCSIACYGLKRGKPSGKYSEVKVAGRRTRNHRVVASQKIGREILPSEEVHHKNRNRSDDSPGNLEVLDARKHRELHNKAAPAAKIVTDIEVRSVPPHSIALTTKLQRGI